MARSAKMKKEKGSKNVYNAAGSPEMKSADDETPGFHKGGKVKKHMKRRDGGKVEGEKEKHRADKKPRGEHTRKADGEFKDGGRAKMEHHKRAAGGRTPYTSGHMTTNESEGDKNNGHEGERPPN